MLNLKACPRCRGDMILEEYLGDSELVCLQCGYRSYPESGSRLEPASRVAKKAA